MGQNGNIILLIDIHEHEIKWGGHFSDLFHGISHPDLYTMWQPCFFKIGPSPIRHVCIIFQGKDRPFNSSHALAR